MVVGFVSGLHVIEEPNIIRDVLLHFCSAIVTFKDEESAKIVAKKLRYFEIDGKQCRSLPYNDQVADTVDLKDSNIFIRNVPSHFTLPQLHKEFECFGKIKMAKIRLNNDHTSKGQAYINFENAEDAKLAIA